MGARHSYLVSDLYCLLLRGYYSSAVSRHDDDDDDCGGDVSDEESLDSLANFSDSDLSF